VSINMLQAHPGRTSPTLRGKFIRESFLCQTVPTAPGNVKQELFNDDQNPKLRTARARLEAHASNGSCRGCHKLTDPIGLGLEQFDGVGVYRSAENDALIDATGALDGTKFANAASWGRPSATTPPDQPPAETLYRYAVGRESARATPTLEAPEAVRDSATAFRRCCAPSPSARCSGQLRRRPTRAARAASDHGFPPRARLMSKHFTRRRFLRGALAAGAAITVGLPLLEVFLNEHGDALASGAPLPLRFGTWFWGCGMTPQRWNPEKEGADFRTCGSSHPRRAQMPVSVTVVLRLP
jgi:hypothetical protein